MYHQFDFDYFLGVLVARLLTRDSGLVVGRTPTVVALAALAFLAFLRAAGAGVGVLERSTAPLALVFELVFERSLIFSGGVGSPTPTVFEVGADTRSRVPLAFSGLREATWRLTLDGAVRTRPAGQIGRAHV